MRNNRLMGLIILGAVIFLVAALITLRAAAQATREPTAVHPAPSAPEESATIVDDPTTAPDAAQSADNNVSFPTDI